MSAIGPLQRQTQCPSHAETHAHTNWVLRWECVVPALPLWPSEHVACLRLCVRLWGCERMSKYESEIEKEMNPRWLPCCLSLKPKRSTLHYTAWHFYGCVYIWFVKVTQSKRLITFNPKTPDVTQATGHLALASTLALVTLRALRERLVERCVISA